MMNDDFKLGLYRHFKGQYYLVTGYVKHNSHDSKDGEIHAKYINVCHLDRGEFSRPIEEFYLDVSKREDNVTGQKYAFQRVEDLDFQLQSVPTEQLLEELQGRTDNPLLRYDLPEFEEHVYCSDYIVGIPCVTPNDERYINFPMGYDTLEQAKSGLTPNSALQVFKRVFIKQEL